MQNGNGVAMKNHKNNLNHSELNKDFQMELVWKNILLFILLHSAGMYGVFLFFTSAKVFTMLFSFFIGYCAGFGTTAGAHRLWSHKTYKAKLPLRIILMVFQTWAVQNDIHEWSRDHRVHHKFTDTDADPHNINRGLFFSHIGWLMCKKHPDVINKGKQVDMSDLERDPVVMFQKNFYIPLVILLSFIFPLVVPVYCWGESWKISFFLMLFARLTVTLNITWCINSFAHTVGNKPYDKFIKATDNPLNAYLTLGEGWHNYHHVFPWDYKTAELGAYGFNWTNAFIDFFAKIGWAYDLKTVSDEIIRKRIERTGDGSHQYSQSKTAEEKLEALHDSINNNHEYNHLWGWDDPENADKKDALIINAEKRE